LKIIFKFYIITHVNYKNEVKMAAPLNNKYQPALAPIPESPVEKKPEKKQAPVRDPLLEIFRLAWSPSLSSEVRKRLNDSMKTPANLSQNALAAAAKK
jgi:hypothetical protein